MGEATPGPRGPRAADREAGERRRAGIEDVLAPHVIEAVRRAGGYGGGIYLRSRDRRSLVLAVVTGVPRSVLKIVWRLPVSGALPAAEAYRTGTPIHLADEGETMRRYPQMSVGLPYRFASDYRPLRVGDEVVGVLAVLWSAAVESAGGEGLGGVATAAEAVGDSLTELAARGWPVEYEGEPASVRLPGEVPGVRVGLIDWHLDTGEFLADEEACAVLGTDPATFGGTIEDLEARVYPEDLRELRAGEQEADEEGWVRGRIFRVADTWVGDAGGGRWGGVAGVGGGVDGAGGGAGADWGTGAAGAAGAGTDTDTAAAAEAGGTRGGGGPPGGARDGAWREGVPGDMEDDRVRYRPVELWARSVPPVPGVLPEQAGRRLVGVVVDAVSGTTAAEAAERLPDGVFSLDPDGRVTYANRRCEQLLRCAREDLLGRHPWQVMAWLSDPAYEDRYRAAMLSQQTTSFLVRHPVGEWLGFVLYPDVHGLTGRVFPGRPPTENDRGAAAGLVEPEPVEAARVPVAVTRPGALYHVVHMASVLTEAVSVQEVCRAVADRLLPLFGGHELALYLVHDGRMHLVWESGYPEGFLDRFEGVALDARLPGVETLTSGVPIFFESPEQLAAAYPGIALDRMRSWAFLPLIASGHPVGSCILGYDSRHTFTTEDRAALTALGGLVAQALERARLYDAEFTLARGLQDALLPRRLPPVAGLTCAARYLPGTQGMEIGGDWYDVIETARGVALVIGDVEGHSVTAAAVMGQLRSAVNALAPTAAGPAEVVSRVNRLLAQLDAGVCATCCYLELDSATGRGLAVRAGHVPPVLRHADGRTEVLELAGGLMLGVDTREDYPVTPVELERGAMLALYTDGLVEHPRQDIEAGVRELAAMLGRVPADPLEEMADNVIREARRTVDRPDDVALLLTTYQGTG
ncbi:phosphatase [Streptomyces albus subsp. albus]|nr:phosphatase [Streptomyces albus subsp. albus]